MARTVAELHAAIQRHADRAARAERQVRDLAAENQRLRRRMTDAGTGTAATVSPC